MLFSRFTSGMAALLLTVSSLPAVEPAAKPVVIDRLTFSQPLATNGWHFYAWSRSTEGIPASVTTDGNPAVRLDAVDVGAIGLTSYIYPILAADKGWRITMRICGSADYAGNVIWCFVAPTDASGKFLPPAINLSPKLTATVHWQTVELTISRQQLPYGSEHVTFNLTTASVKDVVQSGYLMLDDVVIEALRE